MGFIVLILVVVVLYYVMSFLFGVVPELGINKFIERVNSIEYGMKKEEVHEIIKKRPYDTKCMRNLYTDEIIHEFEYYRATSVSASFSKVITQEIEIMIEYQHGMVINIQKIK